MTRLNALALALLRSAALTAGGGVSLPNQKRWVWEGLGRDDTVKDVLGVHSGSASSDTLGFGLITGSSLAGGESR